ncbi:MAG: hypothetical protein ACQJCO_01745 [cyanobacterium endosymbiont of Rhopalodia sterrenbergii]
MVEVLEELQQRFNALVGKTKPSYLGVSLAERMLTSAGVATTDDNKFAAL